ncbi:ATP-binding protein [Streptomyces vietnamensis]|uniref:ATP-binding protein n=1 Tax=Streptomyces vietnamensis TaxID=362257 RepID=UPI00379C2065
MRSEVSDTASGTALEDLPHLFDRFSRAEKPRSHQTGGSGLGLPIAEKPIEAHGGRGEARSTVGTGPAFVVSLPRTFLTRAPRGPRPLGHIGKRWFTRRTVRTPRQSEGFC